MIYRNQNVPNSPCLCINEILSGTLHAGLWNKFMKRSLCVINKIRFPDGVNMCEDIIFSVRFLLTAERITYLQKAFYHYVQNPDSITISRTRQSFESEISVAKILEQTLDQQIYGKKLMKYKSRIKRNIFFSGLFKNEEYLNCFPETSPYILEDLNAINKAAVFLSLQNNFRLARLVLFFGRLCSKIKQAVLASPN